MNCFKIFILFSLPPMYYLNQFGKDHIYQILVCTSFGSLGALLSVLQRFQSIYIPKYSSWRYIGLRSLTRILLGAIFGGLFIVMQKAGIILNLISSNVFLLYLFSFLSGFSERFIPDLIDKMQNKVDVVSIQEAKKD